MTPFFLPLLRIVFVLVLLEPTQKYLFPNCYSRSFLFAILWMYDLDLIQQIQMVSKKNDKFGWNYFHHKQKGNDFFTKEKGIIFYRNLSGNLFLNIKIREWKLFNWVLQPLSWKKIRDGNGFIRSYILYHGQILRNGNDIIGLYTHYHGQLAFEGY